MKLFDLHADLGYAVLKKKEAGYDDILSSFYCDRWEKGNLKAICMASYFDGSQNWEDMQTMILALREEIDACPKITLVKNAKDINYEDEQLYAMLTVEGMCGIHDHVEEKIDWLYEQGVRMASLCWNERNDLACGTKGGNSGLTALGIRAVKHMERIGMRIDVSHANEQTFWDIFEYTNGMLIASHSNAAALCLHPRNLKQQQIQAIAQRNGLIGAVAAAPFVHSCNEKQDFFHYLRQMQWLCTYAGADHVGYGFDFMEYYDGSEDAVLGIEEPTCAKKLARWIEEHPEYKKTAFENAVRVLSF